MNIDSFIAKWSPSAASERANKDAFLLELCDVLDVPRPDPALGIPDEILERLVALNAERAEEERNDLVRWLRPEYQAPGEVAVGTQPAIPGAAAAEPEVAAAAVSPWPKDWPDRITAVHGLLARGGEWTSLQVARSFRRAQAKKVDEVLRSLEALGLAARFEGDAEARWRGLGRS